MTTYLLDTNVVSEMTKTHKDQTVKAWLDSLTPESIHISELTLGELWKGIAHLPLSRRRTQTEIWLEREVLPMFEDRILPVDRRIWQRWGNLCGEGLRRGRPLPGIDALLAATAIEYDLTLATRDTLALRATGAKLYNPWRS